MSHVVIMGNTTIGERTVVFPNAVLGCAPQNVHYKGEDTELIIGSSGCTIREGVTMHPGMPDLVARPRLATIPCSWPIPTSLMIAMSAAMLSCPTM
jgi:hypothetical protein